MTQQPPTSLAYRPDDVPREAWLDGLRGLAALIVLFSHCSNIGADVVPGLHLGGVAKTGVWLFFMLSAYLLGDRLLAGAGGPGALLGYAIRRVFRVMPLYLLVLVALTAAAAEPALRQAGWNGFDIGAALRHLALLEGREHFWTIPVEMHFYALLPLLMLPLCKISAARRWQPALALCVLAALGYLLLPAPRIVHNSILLPTYGVFFCLGLLVLTLRPHALPLRASLPLLLAALALAVLLQPRCLGWLSGMPRALAVDFYPLTALALALGFHALSACPPLRRPLARGPLPWFGRISFGIYLVHYPLMAVVVATPWLPAPLRGVAILLLGVALSLLLHRLVERPMIRLGHRLALRAEAALPGPRTSPVHPAR